MPLNTSLRYMCFATVFLFAMCGGVPIAQNQANPVSDRIHRLERWLNAVDEHEPGEMDDAASEIDRFSEPDLRDLWVDAQALVGVMRDRKASIFTITVGHSPVPTRITYEGPDLRRMTVLACAAAGLLDERDCVAIRARNAVDERTARLADHAAANRQAGDEDNYIIRRAALLHADLAMLATPSVRTSASGGTTALTMGPRSVRATSSDGIDRTVQLVGVNWDIGRTLLDAVWPAHESKPHPERDPMVRGWYRATSAWMVLTEHHDTKHLDRARALFPSDPDILFLSGCQHEAYARPVIQSAVRTASLPAGFSLNVDSADQELRRAESFFRAARAQDPAHGDARLRLGRVLGQIGRHGDAASELRAVSASLAGEEQRYYGDLFLGAEEEALGQFDAARAAYERARHRYPRAQSPYLALSELAHRTGDRTGTLRLTEEMFDLANDPARSDPWWSYFVAGARGADVWLDELRRPFKRVRP